MPLGPGHFPPKPWHGFPMAALSRAFHSLGVKAGAFPHDLKQQLRDLQDLYDDHDDQVAEAPASGPQCQDGAQVSFRNGDMESDSHLSVHEGEGSKDEGDTESWTTRSRRQSSILNQVLSPRATRKEQYKKPASLKRNRPLGYEDMQGSSSSTDRPPATGRPIKRMRGVASSVSGPITTCEVAVNFYDGIRRIPQQYEWALEENDLKLKRGSGASTLPSLTPSLFHSADNIP